MPRGLFSFVSAILLILLSSSGGPSLSFLSLLSTVEFLAQTCSSAASHCFRPWPRDPSYLAASRWFFVTRLGFGYRSARVEVFQRFFSRPFLHSHARVLERESYQVGFCCCRELCFSVSFEVSCCKISSVWVAWCNSIILFQAAVVPHWISSRPWLFEVRTPFPVSA